MSSPQPARMSGPASPPARWRSYLAMAAVLVVGVLIIAATQLGPPAATYAFTVVAGIGGSLTFNGTAPGPAMTVPRGVNVRVTLRVSDQASGPHSWMLVTQNGTPASGAVFPGANTTNPSVGLAPGSSQTISFVADAAGSYKYICGVDSHYLEMWGYFNVTA